MTVPKNSNESTSTHSATHQTFLPGEERFNIGSHASSVIWITGFSGAGKTTVGRKVNSLLQDMGITTVFLDGDILRGIFAGKWGYEKTDRIELSHAYFRLCNTLASQGLTVVISAVAMYDEIYAWFRTNVDRSLQIYLKVPDQERIHRDEITKKNIYKSTVDLGTLYEVPTSPDLVIENYGQTTPDMVARQIVDAYKIRAGQAGADKGRGVHWNEYYTNVENIYEPSSFALHCASRLTEAVAILEIGCGNGRDSAYLSRLGHRVVALDPSPAAIKLCNIKHSDTAVAFLTCKLPDLGADYGQSFDVVYSRFSLQAMTENEEIESLRSAYRVLKPNGNLFIECRSINDPLARKGEVISSTERIFGHYRRFIVMDDLQKRLLEAGFRIENLQESNDVAALGEDNPAVLRAHATRVT